MDRKVLKTVYQVKADIEALLKESGNHWKPSSAQKAMAHLTRLNSMRVTWDMLKETRIGYSVNDLRKASSHTNVKEHAKRLLRKWKGLEETTTLSTLRLPVQSAVVTGTTSTCVELGNGATREGSIINTTSSLAVSDNVASPLSNGNDLEEDDRVRWSVRLPQDDAIGLKLIFAKRKPDHKPKVEGIKKAAVMSR